jgi:tetratricopeptide (TPR) repeat protein
VREGAKAIVTGSIANTAGVFTVNVKLVSTERDEVLAAFRESAADSSELLSGCGPSEQTASYRIGESLRSLRSLPPLDDQTTRSLAALRKYSEGQRLYAAGRRSEAIRRYEEAVSIDTAFASAYIALGSVYGSIAEPGRARAAQRRGLAHRDRLPFTERTFAVAQTAFGAGEFDVAIDTYTRFLDRYPDGLRRP